MAIFPCAVQHILVAYLIYTKQFVSPNPLPLSYPSPFPLSRITSLCSISVSPFLFSYIHSLKNF